MFFKQIFIEYELYLKMNNIFSTATYSPTLSADLSTLFDVGGIIGAIVAGVLSDYSGMSASTCAVMLALSCPTVSKMYNACTNKFT